MRVAVLLILSTLVGASGWIVVAQDGRSGTVGRPLDLPSGGAGDNDDEEDAPESITFYGSEYEGDGFFWCLDKSCSMGWAGGAPLATLKQEMTMAIGQLSNRADFSIVAFNTTFNTWSEQPRRATVGNKASALGFVQSMVATGTTCMGPAGVKMVQICNLSTKRRKSMILVGDGVPECPPPYTPAQGEAVLSDITSANYQRTPLHTIFISASEQGIAFMQQLAAQNGGTFTHVP